MLSKSEMKHHSFKDFDIFDFRVLDGDDWTIARVDGPIRELARDETGGLIVPEGVSVFHPLRRCVETPTVAVIVEGSFTAKFGEVEVTHKAGSGCWDYIPVGNLYGKAAGDLRYICVCPKPNNPSITGQIIRLAANEAVAIDAGGFEKSAVLVCRGSTVAGGRQFQEMELVNLSRDVEFTAGEDGAFLVRLTH